MWLYVGCLVHCVTVLQAVSENVERLHSLVQKAAPGQPKFQQVGNLLLQLTQEWSTWELIRTLYFDRLHSDLNDNSDDEMEVDSLVGWHYFSNIASNSLQGQIWEFTGCGSNVSDNLGVRDTGRMNRCENFLASVCVEYNWTFGKTHLVWMNSLNTDNL